MRLSCSLSVCRSCLRNFARPGRGRIRYAVGIYARSRARRADQEENTKVGERDVALLRRHVQVNDAEGDAAVGVRTNVFLPDISVSSRVIVLMY